MASTSGHSISLVTTPQQFPRCTCLNPPSAPPGRQGAGREGKFWSPSGIETSVAVRFVTSTSLVSVPMAPPYVVMPAPIGSDKSHHHGVRRVSDPVAKMELTGPFSFRHMPAWRLTVPDPAQLAGWAQQAKGEGGVEAPRPPEELRCRNGEVFSLVVYCLALLPATFDRS